MGTAIKNIDLAVSKKERFTINNDESRVIELNLSDMNVLTRYSEILPKLNEAVDSYGAIDFNDDSEEAFVTYGKAFRDLDNSIREAIDFIFDYPVSNVCSYGGSMFDLQDGSFRFEAIIETLFGMYDSKVDEESKKLQKKMKAHTDKYLPQDRKRKSSK